MIIDGKKIAEGIISKLKQKTAPRKFFAAFLVGDDSPSISFLKQKEKTSKELGVDFRIYKFSKEIKQDKLREEISKIALGKTCGGAILQLPLPAHINAQYVLNTIPKEKDVDVLGERALGAFYAGRNIVLPPPVSVLKEILESEDINTRDKRVCVVGPGDLIGKPIVNWLFGRTKEVFIFDEGSDFKFIKKCEIMICGTGVSGLIKPRMIKRNSVVIDFGYSFLDGNISGDFEEPKSSTSIKYTPTPGGTGPILVAKLFENFYKLCEEK